MKKQFLHVLITVLLTVGLLLTIPQTSMAAEASLSGSSSVQPGNTVTLTLSVSGSSIYGLSGTLNYGSNLTFTNYGCSISGWSMEVNGNNFSAYGTTASSGGAVLTVTMQVASNAAANSDLTASFENVTVSDGETDISLGTASWNGKVSAPPSNNCDLSSIIVNNSALSPAFNKNTTNYTCTVPYDVEKLSLDYNRADVGQTVTISGNENFVVGENTVTMTVKAASGATKTYTIVVTRQQDPNYKFGMDATLSALEIEGTTISPAFDPEIKEYIAYVSHETRRVKLSGIAHDEKALRVTGSEENLLTDGVTDLTVVCTAEDGKTKEVYTVHVYRMPAYTGGIPQINYTNEEDSIEVATETNFSLPMVITLPLIGEVSTLLAVGIAAGIIVILLFLLGFLIGRIRRSGEWTIEEDEYEESNPYENEAQDTPVTNVSEDTAPVPIYSEIAKETPPPALTEEPTVSEWEEPTAQTPEASKEKIPLDTMSLDELLRDIHNM